jgi:glutamate-1-semialdehyde aminotransferase
MFISLAHSAEDLDRTVSLAREASAAVAASIEVGR